jgi:isopenicillin-N epimerase
MHAFLYVRPDRRADGELALDARRILRQALGVPPPCPGEMIGSLASIPVPDGSITKLGWRRTDPLQRALFDTWGIEVPIVSWPATPRRLMRISAALHNRREPYVRLATAPGEALAAERGTPG